MTKETFKEKVEHAAHDIDALPTNRREAFWMTIWNGAVLGTMVVFMEYAVLNPLWTYVVLPVWHALLKKVT